MTTLSGRFLPMDPRDERVLDVLESENSRSILVDISQNPDGPAGPFSDSATRTKKWSKRSEAARKRWADPAYRAKMLAKRAAKRRLDADAEGKQHRLEIGCMDSITLCDDDKAKAINDYVRSNKLRSEKLSAFHQNTKEWMENRLSEGRSVSQMSDEEYVLHKKEQRERRRQSALKRVRNIKEKKKKEQAASRATHK